MGDREGVELKFGEPSCKNQGEGAFDDPKNEAQEKLDKSPKNTAKQPGEKGQNDVQHVTVRPLDIFFVL